MKHFLLRIKQNKKAKCVFKFILAEALTITFSIIEAIILAMGVFYHSVQNQMGVIEHFVYFILVTIVHSYLILTIKD